MNSTLCSAACSMGFEVTTQTNFIVIKTFSFRETDTLKKAKQRKKNCETENEKNAKQKSKTRKFKTILVKTLRKIKNKQLLCSR